MNLIFTNDAELDLNEIYDYIKLSSFSTKIAQDNLNKIIESTMNLTIFPLIGRTFEYDGLEARIISTHKQFTIIYLSNEDNVEILRVFYKGRDY